MCTFGNGLTPVHQSARNNMSFFRAHGARHRVSRCAQEPRTPQCPHFYRYMSITCGSFGNPMRPTATHGRSIQSTPAIKKTHPVCPACNCSSSCCCALPSLVAPTFPHQAAVLVNFQKPFLSLSDPSSPLTRPPCIGTNHVVDFYFSSLFLSSQCPASASRL